MSVLASGAVLVSGWTDLRAHLRTKYHLAVDEEQCVGLHWRFAGATDVQREFITPVIVQGRPSAEIVANVVAASAMSAHEAMLLNARIAFGALCIADGFYLLRAVLPLDGVTFEVIDRALELIANEAARLRHRGVPAPALAPYYE